MSTSLTVDARLFSLGDFIELNSGGPPMRIVEIRTPGRHVDGADIVAWWRGDDDAPQVAEFDARCVHPVSRQP